MPTTHAGSRRATPASDASLKSLLAACCVSSKRVIKELVQGVTDRSFLVAALSSEQTAPDQHVDLSLAQLDH